MGEEELSELLEDLPAEEAENEDLSGLAGMIDEYQGDEDGLSELSSEPPSAAEHELLEAKVAPRNLSFLLDIELDVTFEVGRAKMMINDLLTLGQGSVVELHRLVGEDLDLLINGKLIAKGEVVVVNEKFGCRITKIIPPEDRIKYLTSNE